MAIIPNGQEITMRTAGTSSPEVGSAYANSQYETFTMQDIVTTVDSSTDEYEVIITRLWSQGNDLSAATEIKNTSNRSLTWIKESTGSYSGAFDGALNTAPHFSKIVTIASQCNRHQTSQAMITQSGYWYQNGKITAKTFRLTDITGQSGVVGLEPENLGTGGQGYIIVEVRIYP